MNRQCKLWLPICALALCACGNGSGGGRDRDSGDAADVASETGGGDAPTGDLGLPDCSANIDDCDYPSLGLDFQEVAAIAAVDEETGRTLPLVARVPDGDGPFPVVIFSHGGGFYEGGENHSGDWGETLAAHGYVAINVGHDPADAEAGAAWCAAASVPEGECVAGDEDDQYGLVAVAKGQDLRAVLDELPALSAASEARGGPALDLERVAVMGWSGGSRGPSVLAGARVIPTENAPLFEMPDERVRATILLSPAGPGFGGYYDGPETSWDTMRGPVLVATGVNDVKPLKPELDGANRRMAFDLQPADGTRWMLYSTLPVGVGGHGTFNLEHLEDDDERLVRYSRALQSAARAFLDAFLKDDAAALAWLESDHARVLAGDAEWLHR